VGRHVVRVKVLRRRGRDVVLQQRDLKVVEVGRVDLLVGVMATSSVDCAAGVSELDLEVGFIGLLGAVSDEEVVVCRDAVVVTLDEAAGGGVVVVGGEREAGVSRMLKTVWTRPLPKVVSPTMRARVVLQGAGDDLGG